MASHVNPDVGLLAVVCIFLALDVIRLSGKGNQFASPKSLLI